jgi:hypothetical protein
MKDMIPRIIKIHATLPEEEKRVEEIRAFLFAMVDDMDVKYFYNETYKDAWQEALSAIATAERMTEYPSLFDKSRKEAWARVVEVAKVIEGLGAHIPTKHERRH